MGSYFDALGPWIYELGVVVNGHLDYMIPGGVPHEAKCSTNECYLVFLWSLECHLNEPKSVGPKLLYRLMCLC